MLVMMLEREGCAGDVPAREVGDGDGTREGGVVIVCVYGEREVLDKIRLRGRCRLRERVRAVEALDD